MIYTGINIILKIVSLFGKFIFLSKHSLNQTLQQNIYLKDLKNMSFLVLSAVSPANYKSTISPYKSYISADTVLAFTMLPLISS